jgi:glutaconate CoA-transferase subunit B
MHDEVLTAVMAGRELRDGEVCFVGIGSPSIAALLAKHRHAPALTLIYESGAIDASPERLPLSTGSPSIARPTAFLGDCIDVFGAMQAGRVDVGILSAAQVDRHGNLNSTIIGGSYRRPDVRLVGSGGAHDIAALVGRLLIVMPHDPRRFVPEVDFITAPGLAPDGRRPAGTQGEGPVVLVTPRGTFDFSTGELRLTAYVHGSSPAHALEGLSWDVPVAPDVHELPAVDSDDERFVLDLLAR